MATFREKEKRNGDSEESEGINDKELYEDNTLQDTDSVAHRRHTFRL